MDLKIKNKLELIDLATYGSQARKLYRPNVLFTEDGSKYFRIDDILSARGTYKLIEDTLATSNGVIALTQAEYDRIENPTKDLIYLIVEQRLD